MKNHKIIQNLISNLEVMRIAIDKNAIFAIISNSNAIFAQQTSEKCIRMPC